MQKNSSPHDTPPSFEVMLDRYADLIVRHGMNVQPEQEVVVSGEICHRVLMHRVMEQAYRAGAGHVSLEITDPVAESLHARLAPESGLRFVPNHVAEARNELVASEGAVVRIDGTDDPSLFQGIDPKRVSTIQAARRKARDRFYEEGIHRWKVQWCVAAGACPGWGTRLFPGVAPADALRMLWEQLFRICRVDSPDYLARWHEHDAALHRRAAALNELRIVELHFTGDGTDLRVGLSDRAYFDGGTKRSSRDALFTANLPTEEVFTTPDWRKTSGVARVTRPVVVNQTLVRNLVVHFREGEIVDFTAAEGESAFRALLEVDTGARRLGEVALVGIDSPVYQSGVVFQEILLDENACCHVALGSAYKNKLRGSDQLTADEFAALGCNESSVHVDFMISSEGVDVSARTAGGATVPLIGRGLWCLEERA